MATLFGKKIKRVQYGASGNTVSFSNGTKVFYPYAKTLQYSKRSKKEKTIHNVLNQYHYEKKKKKQDYSRKYARKRAVRTPMLFGGLFRGF